MNVPGIDAAGKTLLDPDAWLGWAAPTSRQRASARAEAIEVGGWEPWLRALFAYKLYDGFAPYHRDFWEWAWAIALGEPARPFVGLWPRDGGKSTSAELACCLVGARRARRYVLYVCASQMQAERHVAAVGALLESPQIAEHYPELGRPAIRKFGNVKGWRRDQLWTASGFVVDAIGLDSDMRGLKAEDVRPDFIVLDDIDDRKDSRAVVEKNLETLAHAILPAGSHDAAILAIQNLIHRDSVFARIADGRAEILSDRILSGPHPAIVDPASGAPVDRDAFEKVDGRWRIAHGEPLWGPPLKWEGILNRLGPTAFIREDQQLVDDGGHGLYAHVVFEHCRPDEVPDLVRTTVWVDPTVTEVADAAEARARALEGASANAIQCDGVALDGTIFRLYSLEEHIGPNRALQEAIRAAIRHGSTTLGVETNQGGDLWQTQYRASARALGVVPPRLLTAKAGAGTGSKVQRSNRMLMDYERGAGIVHVRGTHHILEGALRRFPNEQPLDLADAAYWAWADLRNQLEGDAATPGVFARALVPMRGGRR